MHHFKLFEMFDLYGSEYKLSARLINVYVEEEV